MRKHKPVVFVTGSAQLQTRFMIKVIRLSYTQVYQNLILVLWYFQLMHLIFQKSILFHNLFFVFQACNETFREHITQNWVGRKMCRFERFFISFFVFKVIRFFYISCSVNFLSVLQLYSKCNELSVYSINFKYEVLSLYLY